MRVFSATAISPAGEASAALPLTRVSAIVGYYTLVGLSVPSFRAPMKNGLLTVSFRSYSVTSYGRDTEKRKSVMFAWSVMSFTSYSHSFFYFFFILQLYCPIGISLMGNSGCFPQGKPAASEPRYPTYGAY